MSLTTGTKLGPYEIVGQIGAGGMGEVYKAKDTRLDRTVAIKVLPSHLSGDAERRQRFEREARAVSSLNHPHICTLYDIGEQDGTDFLVMEYIEGESLADRLKKGALPLEQALRHAIEIADALDKAHRQGVVHRDLKPGNIMLTKSGAKLLDFGLAKLKASAPGQEGSVLSALPTEEKPLTEKGSILGTFQYMAPEQLEGKDADARTDIFAFGTVLYEMVTGKRAFEGKSQASLISAIMSSAPRPISELQTLAPPALEHLVMRCLSKDPDRRWQAASDVVLELEWITKEQGGVSEMLTLRRPFGRLAWAGAGLMVGLLVAAIVVWNLVRTSPPVSNFPTRLEINLPPGESIELGAAWGGGPAVALSLDGRRLVYVAVRGNSTQLHLRSMDEPEARPIPDTKGASSPFFSPDSQWVGFFAEGKLKKVSLSGGAAIPLCDASLDPRGASWGPDGKIVFSPTYNSGLFKVSADGGAPEPLTTLDSKRDEKTHRFPQILPDGKSVLFSIGTSNISTYDEATIAVLSLKTGEQKMLVEGGTNPSFLPTGHIAYARAGSLMAVPFAPDILEVIGAPFAILEGVVSSDVFGTAQYSFSRNGTLVYVPGGPELYYNSLVWVDRKGQVRPIPLDPQPYFSVRFSPDGQRLAIDAGGANEDVWIYDLERHTLSRLTAGWDDYIPVWSPDSNRVVYAHGEGDSYNLYCRAADGSGPARQLATSEYQMYPSSYSPDGILLAYTQIHPTTGADIWLLSMEGERAPLIVTPFNELSAMFSPDGRWLAYSSDETGRDEVYVRSYPDPAGKRQVSTGGGTEPIWNRNGREIFYRRGDKMMAVALDTGSDFSQGKPMVLFEGQFVRSGNPWLQYDVSPDGQRFVMIKHGEGPAPTQVKVILDWFEELKRLVPTEN